MIEVLYYFYKEPQDAVEALQKRQQITITGQGDGKVVHISIKNAII